MRLTMSESDPCFNVPLNNVASVYLNGKLVASCTEADEELGYIEQFVHEAKTSWETERIYGKVEIILPEGTPRPKPRPKHDLVVEANRVLLLKRSQLGLVKYGVSLDEANLSRVEHLQHALEEALDLANYLQAELMRIKGVHDGSQEGNGPQA